MQELMLSGKSYMVLELPGRPKALLDRTVAEIYEIETSEVNRAVSRNPEKFPSDFYFELTQEEKAEVLPIWNDLKFSVVLPKAFTWEGCNMLATILKSDVAARQAVQIIRGFTTLEKVITDPDPLMVSALHLVEVTKQYLTLKREQEAQKLIQETQALKMRQIEAKQDASLKQSGFYSILAYGIIRKVPITIARGSQLGKAATKLSKEMGVMIGSVPDARYGFVNTYHESVLEKLFAELS